MKNIVKGVIFLIASIGMLVLAIWGCVEGAGAGIGLGFFFFVVFLAVSIIWFHDEYKERQGSYKIKSNHKSKKSTNKNSQERREYPATVDGFKACYDYYLIPYNSYLFDIRLGSIIDYPVKERTLKKLNNKKFVDKILSSGNIEKAAMDELIDSCKQSFLELMASKHVELPMIRPEREHGYIRYSKALYNHQAELGFITKEEAASKIAELENEIYIK